MRILAILSFFLSFTALAQPVCLMLGTCMEYQGQIIDIRSPSQRATDEVMGCDMATGRCSSENIEYSATPKGGKCS